MSLDLSFRLRSVHSVRLEAPLKVPRRNAFGQQHSRPALLVSVTLEDGPTGWGEVFCNWPPGAAAHRQTLISRVLAGLATGSDWQTPGQMLDALTTATRLLALQCGEPGPFAQAIAGLDVAVWDALARRHRVPLHALLAGSRAAAHEVPAYASALTGERLEAVVPGLCAAGWRGFKLKVGFGPERDAAALSRLREMLGPEAAVMADANQTWTLDAALAAGPALREVGVTWIEEPLPADAPAEDWARAVAALGVPVAAGENLRGPRAFGAALDAGVAVLQPDVIKWGGLTGGLRIAALARENGAVMAPHYLRGGVGLAATAHLAVAVGAAWLEVDATDNPLRDLLLPGAGFAAGPVVRLPDAPGHGAVPDLDKLAPFVVSA